MIERFTGSKSLGTIRKAPYTLKTLYPGTIPTVSQPYPNPIPARLQVRHSNPNPRLFASQVQTPIAYPCRD